MEGNVSLGAVVANIMESLSEAIAQLMLYVIAMQESNSQVPAHIPKATEGVTSACSTLADVASSVAEEEYDGYPEIQTPIIDAAKDVRASGKQLITAVNNLQGSPNRAAGWARLLDECKVISTQTCYILQLVYGAEFKKFLAEVEAAKELGGNTPAALAAKDPQKFADQVSELAGMAEALAASLMDKIKDEESPLRREEMKKAAEQLKKLADEIPALANQVLAKPSDMKNHAPFDNKLKELAKVIASISEPFKTKLDMLPDKPPKVDPMNPTPTFSPSAQRKANDPPPRRGDPPIPTATPPPEPTYNPPPIPPQAAKAAKEDVKRLLAAAAAKDTPKLTKEAQMLPGSVSPLVEALENQARACHDQERAEQLQKTAEELKRIVPKIVTVGAQALKEPAAPTQQLQKTQQQFDTLADYAQQLSAPANEVQVAALAKKILTELPKLKEPVKVEAASRNLDHLVPFLNLPTKELIAKAVHPQTKAKLTEALKNVENSVPEAVNHAKASAKNQKDVPTLQKLDKALLIAEEALRDIIQNCGTDVLAAARKQADDAGILDVFATLEQPAQVSTTEKKIVARQPEIQQRALEIAKTSPDNHVKEDIAKNVALLDKLLPEQIKTAHEVVKKPTADEPKKKLKQSTQEMSKALHNIATDVQQVPPASTPVGEMTPTIQDLVQAIQNAKDPKGEESLKKILDKLAPALEKMAEEEEARANHVNDVGLDLAQAIAKVAALAAEPKPQPELIQKEIKKIQEKVPEFLNSAKQFVEDDDDPALLDDALGDLAALLPGLISAADEVAKNPRGPKEKLPVKAEEALKNVKFVINRVKPPPEVAAEAPIRRFPKGVKKIIDNMDDPGLDFSKLRDLLKKADWPVKDPPGNNNPDYLRGKKFAEAVQALEKELADKNKKPEQIIKSRPFQDAKKVFQDALADPPKPKPNPVGKAKEIAALLDRLDAAAISPNSDPKKFDNIAKAIEKAAAPLIKEAKKELENIKDPEARRQADDAIKALEQALPKLIEEKLKPVIKGPTPKNKEELREQIPEVAAPLEKLIAAFAPDPAVDLGKRQKQEVQKLAAAAKKADPKAAQDAAKAIKDLNDKFVKAAREKASRAPPKVKDNIEQNIKKLEDKVQELAPIVLEFAKKPNDDSNKAAVAAVASALSDPIDMIIQNLEFAPHAEKTEQEEIAKQILAALKAKNIKKLDPSNLLKISKHLAGLLSDMVQKTGDELHNAPQSELSDRARAALELEKLLAALDKDASAHRGSESNASQSIDALLSSLNLSAIGGSSSGGGGGQTHLSQEISSVAKQIRTRTSGSIEGTNLHNISQGLAADLQKFADADSGNSRSELIVLGRAISANIVRLADELKRLASSCSDPKMQEKLLMNAQVLRNYSTQLKIMASVRAASPKSSRDTSSDQLVVLSQNLATVIGDATNVVSIMKQTKKGQV